MSSSLSNSSSLSKRSAAGGGGGGGSGAAGGLPSGVSMANANSTATPLSARKRKSR